MSKVGESKTYIFRRFFGFDVYSMCWQILAILETPNIERYLYYKEYLRILDHSIAWGNFYDKWLNNGDTIVSTFSAFISDVEENLKELYETASPYMQQRLKKAIEFNNKGHVFEVFTEGLIKKFL